MSVKRARRTNREIDDNIWSATQRIIQKIGFEKATIKAIAAESETGEHVIYNRHDNVEALLDKYILEEYGSWIIQPLLRSMRISEHDEYRANRRFFTEIIRDLYQDEVLRKLLAWELSEPNLTTQKTIRSREMMYASVFANISQSIQQKNPTLAKTLAVILGGIFYISLIKDKSTFWNIDFKTKKGQDELTKTISDMIDMAFIGAKLPTDAIQIATNMKAKGLDAVTIADCTGLSLTQISSL